MAYGPTGGLAYGAEQAPPLIGMEWKMELNGLQS